jgi:ABC-type nitrate/sulfonate/bicarbonate transport system permease component
LIAVLIVVAAVILFGTGMHQMLVPLVPKHPQQISLSPTALPRYTLLTVLRMLAAMVASLIFTFTYATLAAKSRRAEMVLIPILDALQSVPILGYLSFTVVFFVALSPNHMLGAELAAIFAIFTSQAWNIAFSFFQSLRTIPLDLQDASRGFRSSAWQRFWNLEVPFAMPGLIWNMMMSMSGGWFFVVAAEAISVGDLRKINKLFPIAEALHLLEFAELSEGNIKLTAAGRLFTRSDTAERKLLFREHLLRSVPFVAHICHVLDERSGHTAPRERFEYELQDHLNAEATERTLRTAIGWGRYAELFQYDDRSRRFQLRAGAP